MNAQTQTQSSTWDQIKGDGKRLLDSLVKGVDQTANKLSKLAVVTFETEERQKLEKIVESGLVTNFREAVQMMVKEGIKARADLFEQIDKTQADIQNLKSQLEVKFTSQE